MFGSYLVLQMLWSPIDVGQKIRNTLSTNKTETQYNGFRSSKQQ